MNISSLSYKLLLKIGLLGLTGFGSYTAMACPYIQTNPKEDVGSAPIPYSLFPEPILFCKQSFPDSSLTYAPDPNSIVTGGSQVISMGNTVQQYPLSNSVNLSGFTSSNLNINLNSGALSINYPNSGGYLGSPSLFNFYTNVLGTCEKAFRGGNQFKLITRYLRNNGSKIFAISGASEIETVPENTNSLDIIRFKGVKFQTESNPRHNITGDVTLYHANKNNNSTILTGTSKKFCWIGVGARVDINNIDLKNAGDYDLTVDINVR